MAEEVPSHPERRHLLSQVTFGSQRRDQRHSHGWTEGEKGNFVFMQSYVNISIMHLCDQDIQN